MVDAMVQGYLLGFSLILAIGAQNAFVLRQGLRREHVVPVVLACSVSDALLILAGVFAFAALSGVMPALVPLMRWGGAAFLLVYGALALRSAWRGGGTLGAARDEARSLGAVLATCLALTWLNPHVYLDTVALIGSISAGFPDARPGFAAGAITASFSFFFALGFGARWLTPLFARPGAWRVLDLIIACVMWSIAAGLISG
ncbi:LysE/ArgO family amino acid transporter [Tropicimonas sp.]|uniref:LysE/ArgO family amino acid transporter n=1 Tax=Tropicimonas sp. TaxID=2067044 RepID=UPI003A83C88D